MRVSASDNIEVLEAQLDEIKHEVRKEVLDAAEDGLELTKRAAQRQLRESDATATNALINSFVIAQQRTDVGVNVFLITNMDYAAFVEYGTGPKFGTSPWLIESAVPPFSAPTLGNNLVQNIFAWVVAKPLTPYDPQYSQRDLAWFIARHVSIEGTPPQPFMRPAWFETEREVIRLIENAVRRATS